MTSFRHLPYYARAVGDMTVKGLSPSEISKALNVMEALVTNCLCDPLLKDYIKEQQEKQQKRFSAGSVVKRLLPKALAKIEEILEDPEAKHSDQLRAAALIGNWAGLSKADSDVGDPAAAVEQYLQALSEKQQK